MVINFTKFPAVILTIAPRSVAQHSYFSDDFSLMLLLAKINIILTGAIFKTCCHELV